MARGIQSMYLNLIRSSERLDPVFQRRIHQVMKRTKNEDLAAAMARRADTLDEIDADLSNWGSAKVQAAWFARPGRDMTAAVQRLRKEKRVTILEVVASVESLNSAIYEICADRDAARVALPLMINDSVPTPQRQAAARTLAKQFENISYRRQHDLIAASVACGPEITDAFVCASLDLQTTNRVLAVINSLGTKAAEHVHKLCHDILQQIPKIHAEKIVESKKVAAGRYYSGQYDVSNPLRVVFESTKFVAILTDHRSKERDLLASQAQALVELFEKKQWQYDDDLRKVMLNILSNITGSHVRGNPGLDAIKNASTTERLLQIVNDLEKKHELDRASALAAISSPHATVEVALTVSGAFGWGEIDRILEAKNRELSAPVKATLLMGTYDFSDRKIEKYALNTTPHELWMEVVYAAMRTRTELPEQLMSSSYARPDVIPNLPLKVFSQSNTPGWLMTGFSEYLTSQLTTEEAWDAFEVLAPNHLGSVTQIVKACRLSTRHMSKEEA